MLLHGAYNDIFLCAKKEGGLDMNADDMMIRHSFSSLDLGCIHCSVSLSVGLVWTNVCAS